MSLEANREWILGLDLGSGSLGWAALRCSDGEPTGLLDIGARVFPAGVEGLESGRDESRAVKRRLARLARRQTDRRRRRMQKIYRLLASFGLLPHAGSAEERTAVISELDRTLAARLEAHDRLPYVLRAEGLKRKLETCELGRALYHLAQRRGFLSNRKSAGDDDGVVRTGITELGELMKQSEARTLGEYLASLNPHEARIRGRYTSRAMYVQEFEALWDAQAAHYPGLLTAERKNALFSALFFQRPLRDQRELIGGCELEPNEKRAPLWHPAFQRFRILQEVNHLRLIDPTGAERPLTEEERQLAIARLEDGDVPLKEFRKLLGVHRSVNVNLERGAKKALTGNRTSAKLREAFGRRWDELNDGEKLQAIADAASDVDDASLRTKAQERWGLPEWQADVYGRLRLESGYAAFSVRAIERLLPHLETGADVMTARLAEFGEEQTVVLDQLPEVNKALQDVRNPAVLRALTELRKVVNALIRRYGKPREVHIELARDLKSGKEERLRRTTRMRQLEAERKGIAEKLLKQGLVTQPSREDVDKWRLAEECKWRCPYSGRKFSATQLFHSGEVQVEHIVPFSRSLDDSFANKTLAFASANNAKGNRAPREAFEGGEWESILNNVKDFCGPYARHKLERFQWSSEHITELLKDFTEKQLNDTRYASRLASRYLMCLYGGRYDAEGQRIFVSPGQVTAYLRRLWSIEGLLSSDGRKSRDDHRHHAVDAVVIGLTGPRWVKALTDAAQQAREQGRRRFGSIKAPWPDFAAELRDGLAQTVISHRVNRKVSGPLHKEHFYGSVVPPGEALTTVVRKPVHQMSAGELDRIVDPHVRERVALQLALKGGDAQKLEADPPTLPTRDGREVAIRKVRIRVRETARRVGAGIRARNVLGDEYHHWEILRVSVPVGGKGRWIFEPVTIQAALERAHCKDRGPVIRREHGADTEFVCSVGKGEVLQVTSGAGNRLVIVCALEATTERIGFKDLKDARPYGVSSKNRERVTVNRLFGEMRARKVSITVLGDCFSCND